MTLHQLLIFVTVAEREHMTRAAEALHLTQSAVSGAIRALEERHAISLFDRVGRKIQLTREGRAFLDEARQVLRSAASADQALRDLRGLRRGDISIFASQTTASYWLAERLVRFKANYPEISVHLTIGNTTQVTTSVLAGDAEIGFVEDKVVHPAISARLIHKDQLAIVVHPTHPWAKLSRLKTTDMASSNWILRERGSGTRSAFEKALRRRGLNPARLPVALELPSNEAVRAAVEAGGGATAISYAAVRSGLNSKQLATVPFQPIERPFLAIIHRERRPSVALQTFIDTASSQ
jgi:DNA-binding transcriptional LysR family regulator